MSGPNRRTLFIVVLLLILFVLFEGMAFVGTQILVGMGFLWQPESPEGYSEYLSERDPLLGWPGTGRFGTGELAHDGTRIDGGASVSADPSSTAPCVSVYGDSFTWGDEVGPDDAYPAALARLLGCRVANFGTPGYGSDQAFLRYRETGDPATPVVVLGHYSENIIRNVNRYRGFMSNGGFGFKPRFRLDAGTLVLLPIPTLTPRDLERIGDDPDLLPYEYFQPGGDAGIVASGFPYSLTLLRSLGHYRFRARMRGIPSYAGFYESDHPSGALDVTAAILLEFASTAQTRGQQPVIVLIPDEKDLIELAAGRPLPYAPLLARLNASGIKVPDLARAALDALEGREPCALYTRCGGAHFNPEGYALIARTLHPAVAEALAGGRNQ